MCDSDDGDNSTVNELKDKISRLEKKIKEVPTEKHALVKHLRKSMTHRLQKLQAELRAEEDASKTPEPNDFDFMSAITAAGGKATHIGNDQLLMTFGGSAS